MKQNRNQDITDLGAKYISRLKNIDHLNVANTGITDTGQHGDDDVDDDDNNDDDDDDDAQNMLFLKMK